MTGQEQDYRPNRKKHSRRIGVRRKFLKVFLCLGIVGLLVLGAVFIAGLHVNGNRAEYANRFLESLSADYDIKIGDLSLNEVGKVVVTNLRVRAKGDTGDRDLFTSPRVLVTYDWAKFNKTRKLDSILVTKPSLYIDEATLQKLSERAEKGKKNGIDLTALSLFTGSFEVEEGDLFLDLPTAPPIHSKWDFKTDQLGYGGDGLTKNPFVSELRDLEIGDQGVFGKIDKVEASWRFDRKLSRLKIEELKFTNSTATIMPEWITINDPVGPNRLQSVTQQRTIPPMEVAIDQLTLQKSNLKVLGFDGKYGRAVFPDISFETELVSWSDLSVKNGKIDSKGPLILKVENLILGGGRADLVKAERAVFEAESLGEVVHESHLKSADGEKVEVLISDDSLSLWRERNDEDILRNPKPLRIDSMGLPDVDFLMQDFVTLIMRRPLPRVETRVSTTLKNVSFEKIGMQLDDVQSAKFEDFSMHGPGVTEQKAPLVKFPRGKIRLDWAKYVTRSEIEVLDLEEPFINLTDEALGEWVVARQDVQYPEGPVNRPIFKFQDLEITGGMLEADSRKVLEGKIPKVKGTFSLKNADVGQSPDEFGYQLVISDLQLSNHAQSGNFTDQSGVPSIFPGSNLPVKESLKSEEVISVQKAVIDFTASGIQRQRRIKSVTLDGGILKVGEGLKDVVKKPVKNRPLADPGVLKEMVPESLSEEGQIMPTPSLSESPDELRATPVLTGNGTDPIAIEMFPATDTPPASDALSYDILLADSGDQKTSQNGWQIDDLKISKGKVNFDSLIPEMDGLSFGLETEMRDIPLTSDGLLDATKIQSMKLDSLRIRDPYDPFLTVAELPDVYVEFSLAGLANQEIEKIDVISPTLNVGESLFRWIDYLRKYRAINEGATVDVRGANIIADSEEGKMNASKWVINTINATSGRLVIAPYGHPITSLPFPFSATTNVDEGKIKMEMNISEEQTVFNLPDFGVDLIGLTGDLDFNLPIPEKDNNLVQTFLLKGGKWRKFEATALFLTVTYDRYGIYGLFGGKAYGGYANGAFNYYLDKDGQWDAWVAGTDLNTGAVTQALVPNGFVMGGKVNTKLFGSGINAEVNEVTGNIETVGDGWFDIALMENALDHLPETWNGLQKGISKLAVDNLRRFDYDEGGGEVYLKDHGGELKLEFNGEYGKRTLNLHIHDWNPQAKLAGSEQEGQ